MCDSNPQDIKLNTTKPSYYNLFKFLVRVTCSECLPVTQKAYFINCQPYFPKRMKIFTVLHNCRKCLYSLFGIHKNLEESSKYVRSHIGSFDWGKNKSDLK